LVALSLVATQCGTSPSEEEVQKRAQSATLILLRQAFENASEEHDLGLLEEVAFAQARAGDVPSALQTIQSAGNVEWRARRFADLSKAMSASGNIDGAIQVASAIDASSPVKNEALSEIAQAQANAGDINSAIKTSGGLSGYLRVDVLRAVALR
jgi:tetratricopeptide (TPR) repeat protein